MRTLFLPISLFFLGSLLLNAGAHAGKSSALSDKPTPYLADDALSKRAAPLIEIGDPFLDTGNLHPGYRMPTGAVWQPRLWVYGTGRSAVQTWNNGRGAEQSEWINRLDLFANLQLTGTERLLIGVQPLHRNNDFTGRVFTDENGGDRKVEAYNDRINTLFFEGDLSELFPGLDRNDFRSNDLGFSIGRQPIFFQDGFLINDQLDALGLTRNNIRFPGFSRLINLRVTAVYAWNEVNGDDIFGNRENSNSELYGLFGQWDGIHSTVNTDLVYVSNEDNADLWVVGIDAIQRIGLFSTTFRINASHAPDRRSAQADNGVLLFSELSWTPAYSHNNAYINAFVGLEHYRSAARDPLAGGPLGRTGILFAARGIGDIPSALSNRADKSAGLAIGYQMFFSGTRRQWVIEGGGRYSDESNSNQHYGLGLRYQQALGLRFIALIDSFLTIDNQRDLQRGLSIELQVKL